MGHNSVSGIGGARPSGAWGARGFAAREQARIAIAFPTQQPNDTSIAHTFRPVKSFFQTRVLFRQYHGKQTPNVSSYIPANKLAMATGTVAKVAKRQRDVVPDRCQARWAADSNRMKKYIVVIIALAIVFVVSVVSGFSVRLALAALIAMFVVALVAIMKRK